ncbi:X2-like carbohydrate binding domain-containing protein [Cohnella luojiensis]|uniref:Alpha-galactosidase n=1 Tax=Cohnella luojiensis TaxID=652876 RepID=A0A4Y8M3X0_9BACL|nr:X2-like carbohydrate binding domain-containing protein [Cohnella luojiensis]TFE29470.1 hypothetical protein E2980_05605 [Cohnella luojiensis]
MNVLLKKTRLLLLVFIFFTAQFGHVIPILNETNVVKAADNGLGAKPYMGWSSFSMQVFTGNSQIINAANLIAQSNAMKTTLQPYGYKYINVDAGWNGGTDGYGRPIPSTTLYPNGLQAVIDHVHNNGQKFGLYMIPGLGKNIYDADLPIYGTTCTARDIAYQPLTKGDYWDFTYRIDFSNPCAQSYINSIADLLGQWGVDFLKFDSVTPGSGISDLSLDARDDVKAWSQALAPHNIWLELSWALDINYIDYWKQYANGWRVDWDVECYCTGALTTWNNIARLFPRAAQWWRHAGPGGWNDFDSLNVGNGAMDGITQDERRTAMTLWAMSSAPLYIGNDMTNLDSFGIGLLTNDEVIAVHQAGRPAHPVSTESDQQAWYVNNGDGSYTVALFNLGSSSATVNVNWNDIGLNGSATVRDLWSHTDLGTFATGYSSVNLPSHASRLFKVVAQGGPVTANDDEPGTKYTGAWVRNGGKEFRGEPQNLVVQINDASKPNSTISPTTGSFNKASQLDLNTTMTLNGNSLVNIKNGATTLVSGINYTVSGNLVTFKKEYLSTRPNGITQLIFNFSSGKPQYYSILVKDTTVTINNSTVTPVAASFDKNETEQDDVRLTIALNGNQLSSIAHDGTALVQGTHYTVWDNEVTIKKEYLVTKPLGTSDLTFTFSAGTARTIALIVRDSSMGGSKSLNDTHSSITYTGTWPHSFNRGFGDFMDDVHFTEANGNSFEHTFNGTGVEVVTELDTAQGNIDFYVDGLLKKTVGTLDLDRSTQKIVYNITGLANGSHTIKGVKTSGVFMLLDKVRVSLPDLISPITAIFDKALQTDVAFTTTITGVSSITNGAAALGVGTDYTVSGNTVTIKKGYLAAQPNGKIYLTFNFTGGETQNLVMTVKDSAASNSTISPAASSFDKKETAQADVSTTITLNGNTLSSIANRGTVLVSGTDYTVSGNNVTIKKGYLAAQPKGTTKLTFNFSAGDPQTLMITISDTSPPSSALSPTTVRVDQMATVLVDASTMMTLNGNTLSSIKNGGTTLVEGTDYTLWENHVIIKKAYLAALPKGTTNLTFIFSAGKAQNLALVISDTSRGRYESFNDDNSRISYKGTWYSSKNRGFGDYADDVHWTEKNGDSFEFTFKGTGIELISETDPATGDMDIYVDDQFKQTISTSSKVSNQPQIVVYSLNGLSDDTHKVKAVKKSGSFMVLDRLKVVLPDVISPDTASFEKTNQVDITATLTTDPSNLIGITNGGTALVQGTDYTVSGNQVTIKKGFLATQPMGAANLTFSIRGDYQNDVHYTSTNGDSFEYTFTGYGIDFVTAKGPLQGDVDIYVDDVFKQTVSTYNASRLTQQTVYSITGLSNGTHKIKGVKKSGTYMLVDSFKIAVPANVNYAITDGWDQKNGKTLVEDSKVYTVISIDDTYFEVEKGGYYVALKAAAANIPPGATITNAVWKLHHSEESGFGNGKITIKLGSNFTASRGASGVTYATDSTVPILTSKGEYQWNVTSFITNSIANGGAELLVYNNDSNKKIRVDRAILEITYNK